MPPMCVRDTSGMKTTIGCFVSFENSAECASVWPSCERANSMTATWKPRQMPKNGTLLSRA